MDLHDGNERCVEVITLGFLGIQDFHGICSTWDSENGTTEEVLGELFSVEGCGGNNKF
jgi:hypothetical protein